jgi:bacterioferritin-associated ferredoxin
MPLRPDDTVCFCFHVTYRKVERFCRIEKPQAASQISECLSAGTGCGWCVPMLQKIHARLCGQYQPWWRKPESAVEPNYRSPHRDAAPDEIDPQAYAAGRQKYLQETDRKPPPPPPTSD